jgi:hypothetical protein
MTKRELEEKDLDGVVGGGECEICNPNPGGLRVPQDPPDVGGGPDPTVTVSGPCVEEDPVGDFDKS